MENKTEKGKGGREGSRDIGSEVGWVGGTKGGRKD